MWMGWISLLKNDAVGLKKNLLYPIEQEIHLKQNASKRLENFLKQSNTNI